MLSSYERALEAWYNELEYEYEQGLRDADELFEQEEEDAMTKFDNWYQEKKDREACNEI